MAIKATTNQTAHQNLVQLPPEQSHVLAKVLSSGLANDGKNYYLLQQGAIQVLVSDTNLKVLGQ